MHFANWGNYPTVATLSYNQLSIAELASFINNPPFNNWDPYLFAELNVLMDDMEKNKELKVVVFESANEDFFIDHHDVEHRLEVPDVPGQSRFSMNGLPLSPFGQSSCIEHIQGAWPRMGARVRICLGNGYDIRLQEKGQILPD